MPQKQDKLSISNDNGHELQSSLSVSTVPSLSPYWHPTSLETAPNRKVNITLKVCQAVHHLHAGYSLASVPLPTPPITIPPASHNQTFQAQTSEPPYAAARGCTAFIFPVADWPFSEDYCRAIALAAGLRAWRLVVDVLTQRVGSISLIIGRGVNTADHHPLLWLVQRVKPWRTGFAELRAVREADLGGISGAGESPRLEYFHSSIGDNVVQVQKNDYDNPLDLTLEFKERGQHLTSENCIPRFDLIRNEEKSPIASLLPRPKRSSFGLTRRSLAARLPTKRFLGVVETVSYDVTEESSLVSSSEEPFSRSVSEESMSESISEDFSPFP
ncbi:hypothetical protein P154DRAFT_570557 [Amniculicola lignicola CBS 123094]|uniref:Uncharacterized protein n=1 Tax=Amniculicola lignicola CBS 123094 TaxID=1392246 RepID=A0A6A5X2M1_9PLEO|nr:hypothetical protein P154DRAFT_570557 [Amniculicola lignicola CBS 123094]